MAAVSPDDVAVAVATLAGARRVACYGVGREGLVMKAWPCACTTVGCRRRWWGR